MEVKGRWTKEYRRSGLRVADQIVIYSTLVFSFSGIAWMIWGPHLPFYVAVVGGVIAAFIAGIYSLIRRAVDPVQLSLPPLSGATAAMPGECVISTASLKAKYVGEVIVLGFVSILAAAFFGIPSYFFLSQSPGAFYFWIVPLLGAAVVFLTARSAIRSLREIRLYRPSEGREIVLGSDRLSFSIAILEGPARDELRVKGQSYLHVPISQIRGFVVAPARTSQLGGGTGTANIPPYYVLTLDAPERTVHVRRDPLKGQETLFVQEIRKRISIPVAVEDELS